MDQYTDAERDQDKISKVSPGTDFVHKSKSSTWDLNSGNQDDETDKMRFEHVKKRFETTISTISIFPFIQQVFGH
jgi:hypothetical protein